MSNRFKSALAAALESQAAYDGVTVTTIDAAPSDAAVADVVEAGRVVDTCQQDCTALDEVCTGLEKIAATLESLTAPMSPQTASFAYMAANVHLARVGMDMRAAPALESYESASRAKSATYLSMETISEQLKAIWEAIKKAFAAAKTATIAFFTKLVDATEHVARQAEKLAQAAGKAHGAPKSDTVDLGSLAHKLHVGGKVENLMSHFADVAVLIEDLGNFEDHAVDELYRAGEIALGTDSDAAAKVARFVDGYSAPKAFPVQKTTGEGVEHTTKELPGGVVVGVLLRRSEGATPAELLNSFAVIDRRASNQAEVATAAPTASLADIKLIAGGAAAVAKECKKLRDIVAAQAAKMEERQESLLKYARMDSDSDKIFRATAKGALAQMHVPVKLSSHVLQIARAYLGYAHKSLAQYEFEGAKEEAPAAAAA